MSFVSPTPANNYLIEPATPLDPATLNAILSSIAGRLAAAEALGLDAATELATVKAQALAYIQANVGPALAQRQAELDAMQAVIAVAEDQLAALQNGSVLAQNITLPPLGGLLTGVDDVREAFEALVAAEIATRQGTAGQSVSGYQSISAGRTGVGRIALQSSENASATGYLEIFRPSGARAGLIGFSPNGAGIQLYSEDTLPFYFNVTPNVQTSPMLHRDNAYGVGDMITSARAAALQPGLWLRCDGASYPVASYPVLAELLGQRHANLVSTAGPAAPLGGSSRVLYGAGTFLTFSPGTSADVHLSAAGDSWGGAIATGLAGTVQHLAFANNQFIAFGAAAAVRVSAAGGGWAEPAAATPVSGLSGATIYGIAFGGTRYVAIGGTAGVVYHSTNLKTWTAVSLPYTGVGSAVPQGIAAGGGLIIVSTSDGLFVSADEGGSWAETKGINGGAAMWTGETYLIAAQIGGAHHLLTTRDGRSFTNVQPSPSPGAPVPMATGLSGKILIPFGAPRNMESPDNGRSWRITRAQTSGSPSSAAGSPTRFVVVSGATTAIFAPDTAASEFRVPDIAGSFVRAA